MPHRVCHNESLDIKLIVLPDRKKVSDDSEIASAITTEVCISQTSFNFVKDLTDARIIGGVLHGEVSQHKATFDHKLLNLSVTDFFFKLKFVLVERLLILSRIQLMPVLSEASFMARCPGRRRHLTINYLI